MWNAAGTICVVYNGEIYNHQVLRDELISAGRVFVSSHSDTEVLVHGYAEWGTGIAERLNGMFAFAVLDVERGRFFLARDRFGEKPLYYAWRIDKLVFASELKALSCYPGICAEIDTAALALYFPAHRATTLNPMSILRDE